MSRWGPYLTVAGVGGLIYTAAGRSGYSTLELGSGFTALQAAFFETIGGHVPGDGEN